MGWTMLYLFVFLKLPILAACYIVWWAIKQTGDVDEVPSDGGSPVPRKPHPHRPRRPGLPRPPGPAAAHPLRHGRRPRARAAPLILFAAMLATLLLAAEEGSE